jgi:hypothetical protein
MAVVVPAIAMWLASWAGFVHGEAAPPPAALPLSFVREIVTLTIAGDSLEVAGTYFLRPTGTGGGSLALLYPYPQDERLGAAHTVLLETRAGRADWQASAWRELPGGSGARWHLPVTDRSQLAVRTVYRQELRGCYARYIVTTTRAWGRPLERARFEIHLPPGAVPVRFSYPFRPEERADDPSAAAGVGGSTYVFEAADFLPRRDIEVEWRVASGR